MMTARQLTRYRRLYARLIQESLQLFEMYRAAMPDRDEWFGPTAWNGGHGNLIVSSEYIEFHEIGDGYEPRHYYLTLPLDALMCPEAYIQERVSEWQKICQKRQDDDARLQATRDEKDRAVYEQLKRKFEP